MATCDIRVYKFLTVNITPCPGSDITAYTNLKLKIVSINSMDFATSRIADVTNGVVILTSNVPRIDLTVTIPHNMKTRELQEPGSWQVTLERSDGKLVTHRSVLGSGAATSGGEVDVPISLISQDGVPFTEIMSA